MENLNTLFWILSAGFGILFGLMAIMWNSINSRFDRMNVKINSLDHRLSNKIDKLDKKLTDVDRRLWRLEGAFASKDCCMIKDDRNMMKVEG